MNQRVFSVYDSKARVFNPPFLAVHVAVAMRMFGIIANDSDTQIHHHPEDFTLFEVATFDDDTGVFTPLAQHINHGLAANFKEARHAPE